jgi:hypothetical protein
MWCDASLREWKSRHSSARIWAHPRLFVSHFDWRSICSNYLIYFKYSGVLFPMVISQHKLFLILSYTLSLTPLIHSSLSLSHSPSSAYVPLHFTCLRCIWKGNWFVWLASLNKLIWNNVVTHLEVAHNTYNC